MKKLITAALGTSLFSCFAVSPAIAEIVSIDLSGENKNQQNTILSQGVQAILTYEQRITEDGGLDSVPVLNVTGGGTTIETTATYSSFPSSQVQIAEMDQSNNLPEVIFSSFTGGAHCCNEVQVLTFHTPTSQWKVVDVGFFDGGVDGVEDFDQNGVYEFITRDNRFLYKYSSYAGSFPPVQVLQLAGLEMVDISKNTEFLPLHRSAIQAMWQSIEMAKKEGYEVNGVLAGYVATKAILGETIPAWDLMLKRYDQDSDWGLEECRGGYNNEGECLGKMVKHGSFPSALRNFLLNADYLSKDIAPSN
ncbi:MAG: hypothetical protein WBB82_00270 [Limnothrix sp.]